MDGEHTGYIGTHGMQDWPENLSLTTVRQLVSTGIPCDLGVFRICSDVRQT